MTDEPFSYEDYQNARLNLIVIVNNGLTDWMWLQKRVKDGMPYRSVVMKFSRECLKEFFQTLNRREIPKDAKREKASHVKFPSNCLDVRSLFESLLPYFDAETAPDDEILKMK